MLNFFERGKVNFFERGKKLGISSSVLSTQKQWLGTPALEMCIQDVV